jgi:hypothetical protein
MTVVPTKRGLVPTKKGLHANHGRDVPGYTGLFYLHTSIMTKPGLVGVVKYGRTKLVYDRSEALVDDFSIRTKTYDNHRRSLDAPQDRTLEDMIDIRVGIIGEHLAASNKRLALLFDNPTMGEIAIFYALRAAGLDFDLVCNAKKNVPDDTWFSDNIVANNINIIELSATDKQERTSVLTGLIGTHIVVTADADYIIDRPEQYMLDYAGLTDEFLNSPAHNFIDDQSVDSTRNVLSNMGGLYRNKNGDKPTTVRDMLWLFTYFFRYQPEIMLYAAQNDGAMIDRDYIPFFDTQRFGIIAWRSGLGSRFNDSIFKSYIESNGNYQHAQTYNEIVSATFDVDDIKTRFAIDNQLIRVDGTKKYLQDQ